MFATPSPALEAVGLTKRFGAVEAVSNLSFTVPSGSVTGLVGPPGAGKSVTVRMLLGLVTPTGGHATIAGRPFASLDRPARTVGAALDVPSAHPRRTALDHLLVYCAAISVPDDRAHEVLATVGLTTAARQRVGAYSPGMCRRLALATALLGDPRTLVLDDPGHGLDQEGLAWLHEFLRAFVRTGRTVLVAGLGPRELERTADRVVIVDHGTLVFAGALDDLRSRHGARVLVAAADPAVLALMLGAHGHPDTQLMPDGRLAVRGASPETVARLADAAAVRLYRCDVEQVGLDRMVAALTSPPAGPRRGAPHGHPPTAGATR